MSTIRSGVSSSISTGIGTGLGDGSCLIVWTIYQNVIEYPGKFVMRAFRVTADGPRPLSKCAVANTLDDIRDMVPLGLYRLDRDPTDPPEILETWI